LPLTVRESRLKEFVDRRAELGSFCEMLKSGDPPVLLISGRSGIGKSSLLARLVDECASQGVIGVEIDCRNPRLGNYQQIMIAAAKRLGLEHFRHFVNLVNHFSDPRQKLEVSVPANVNIHGAVSVGTVNPGAAVIGVLIEQATISISGQESSIPEAERIAPLTDRFLEDLEPLLAKNPIVFFFDQLESATTETRKWIWEELFRPIRGGGLTGARFVLCVQQSGESSAEIGDLRSHVKRAVLHPLSDVDIAEYLVRRQGPSFTPGECQLLAEAIFLKTEGVPLDVAAYVDMIQAYRTQKAARGA
jgi:hypothetical protein